MPLSARVRALIFSLVAILAATATGRAAEQPRQSLCLMLESAATANKLPLPFLVRVIWRESRFDPKARGPSTRSGARAEGIAQFMPGTAAEHDLADPYDPVEALPKAAAFLAALRDEFGNLGLAAAAYNAGPARVQGWLDGARTLPGETRAYVRAVTGRDADDWAKDGAVTMVVPKSDDCLTLVASLEQGPSRFFYELEQRVATAIGKPWGIELAAGFSRARVLAAYAKLMDHVSAVVGTHDPIVTGRVLRSRGTRPLYQARIGADTRQAANAICTRIRRAGEACVVMRNRG
ncbi:MAG TPA: lytic transglycosylase domain-containing protein [Pseudolabrys sp.]